MKPNASIIAPLNNVADLAQVMDIPKGELFHVGMNPWNGNFVFTFQDNPDARFFISLIIGQLADMVNMFDVDAYEEPNGQLVDYEDEERYREKYGAYPPRRRQRAGSGSASPDDLPETERERTVA